MGNICGKTEPEAFSQPGRVLGSAPAPAAGPLQPLAQRRFRQRSEARQGLWEAAQLRKLQEIRMTPGGKPRKLQRALQARAKASSKPGGKLQTQLAAQKKQTRSETLNDASQEQLRAREADQAAEARNWA
ncbi:Uncharacterized protein LW93_10262 [Fusarium fujikuroi]|nr:Uncharacterized protein LW93_10262 [Fusarium fujikuroi]